MSDDFDKINDATGFASGDKFADAAEVAAYFTPANQRNMFGRDAVTNVDTLDRWAAAVIANRWHMTDR